MAKLKMPTGKQKPPTAGPKPDKCSKDYIQPVMSMKSAKDCFRKKK